MWNKQQKPSLPTKWSEELWNDLFGSSPWFRLIVDGYQFKEERSELTRKVLVDEPRASHVDWDNDETFGSRSESHTTREYYGRLGLDASHPAHGMRVTLFWNTDRHMDGDHEWWHWGTGVIPTKGVYGYVNPVEYGERYARPISLSITLGTDQSDEALFEQLFLRSKMPGSNPVIVHGQMKSFPIQDSRVGLVSEYSIEHSWRD